MRPLLQGCHLAFLKQFESNKMFHVLLHFLALLISKQVISLEAQYTKVEYNLRYYMKLQLFNFNFAYLKQLVAKFFPSFRHGNPTIWLFCRDLFSGHIVYSCKQNFAF